MSDADQSGKALTIDGGSLSIDEMVQVARFGRPVAIGDGARKRLEASQAALALAIGSDVALYGVNTGFGSLSRKRIAPADLEAVQHNLIRSHAAGVGAPLAEDVVRAMMLALVASLCRGLSGVRTQIVEGLAALLNAGVTPVVPEIGSVGASGDLAPLAHVALVLIGEGEATHEGRRVSGAEGMRIAGATPVRLGPKEGLALING
ncbi:MAG: aromatic amino acid lyase, partial [Planctomycetota bacterium]|nr:aromatic amino acid lyase [Planctomycetota bacterium]